ncbi:sensor histidine kinase [Sphingosinithalassobacter portus]|uniref:sensor histidine kinase n=1 Tax=Stakelama portus TaxID=2676234 RepID=UPI00137A6EB3|nr:sensor histidine kinase [Sphingosinithalassobacter portus]
MALLFTPAPALPQTTHAQQPIFAQYNHRAWRLVDGTPPDIWSLAQAPDGFLWIGSGAGLYRFDGISFEEVTPRVGSFPSRNITALAFEPDGTLWIGYFSGEVSRLRNGRLDNFLTQGATVEQIVRDRDGAIWVARSAIGGGLLRFERGRWQRMGRAAGAPAGAAFAVLAASDGAIWANVGDRILVRRRGAARFEIVARTNGVSRLSEGSDGRIWASGEVFDIRPAMKLAQVPAPPGEPPSSADRMIFARNGTLWQTPFSGGVLAMRGLAGLPPAPVHVERFGVQDGLTSRRAVPLLEDREGNIWIGTNLGLNRLRPVSAMTALGIAPGSRGGFELAVRADGTVFIAEANLLYRVRPGGQPERVRRFAADITTIEADGDDIIVALPDRLLRLEPNGAFRTLTPRPPGEIVSWSRDAGGGIWASVVQRGVFHLVDGSWHSVSPSDPQAYPGTFHTPSGPGGGEWLYAGDQLYRRERGQFHRVPPDRAPRVGHIALLSIGPSGVLAGGELGLALLDRGRFRTLDPRIAPDLSGISGIVQSPDGTLWINGVRGLVRTTRAALVAALATPGIPLRHHLFSAGDGLPGVAQQDEHKSTAVRGGDGRIWVANNSGVGAIDPSRIVSNREPPPVVIRSASANGRSFTAPGALSLPAGTQNLRITYTALSLAAAERNRFRYRLIGVDKDWVDAGSRREAFYANLPPGAWRFQVIAANNDGVWNEEGASIAITIPPMFYQTWWFRLLCLAALLMVAWLFYLWRLRENTAQERARVEAQIGERERIARELHDTLLQGMQGLMLRFQAAANATPSGSKAHALLETALERADDVIVQARDRVSGLRGVGEEADLMTLLETLAERFREDGLAVSLRGPGATAKLTPQSAEQLLAIIEEALANVLRHAQAREAIVDVENVGHSLVVRLSDHGIGLPADVLRNRERPGHFGLPGMRERVKALGGEIAFAVPSAGGTEIVVRIPLSGERRWRVPRRWKMRGFGGRR